MLIIHFCVPAVKGLFTHARSPRQRLRLCRGRGLPVSYILYTHVLPTLIIGAGREFVKQGFGNDLRLVSSLLIL